jgi:uncharacterized protein
MTSATQTLVIETFVPMLRSLSELLDRAAAYAKTKQFEPTVLVNARLAPDMFTLAKQVQFACIHAEDATARLTGQQAPTRENTEQTLAELQARIASTLAYVEQTSPAAFEGADTRPITIALQGNLVLNLNGAQLLTRWSLPNFYFHLVTAYDILRHNGVAIGKPDYMSQLREFIRPAR